MTRYALKPENSTLDVWTFKEGLLSKVAHDLQIAASGLEGEATVEQGKFSLKISIPVDKLAVKGSVHDGKTTPMSDKDHREIETTTKGSAVLDAAKFPKIVYSAEGKGDPLAGPLQADGTLALKGASKPVPVQLKVKNEGGKLSVAGEVTFKQTAFGIKPYSAMLGTLKVKDEVRISWSLSLVPAPVPAGV